MTLNTDTINNAYNALKSATSIANEKRLIALDYKAILESEKSIFTTSGEVVGSNAEQRKAFVENHFAEGNAELRAKERAQELARLQTELAQIEVNRVNAIMRYMELQLASSDGGDQ